MVEFTAVRKHEIHAGHRVYGHAGKCQHLHGHSYIIHFYCQANILNELGMVIDFQVIKTNLCQWLDDNFDHRMLIWEQDPSGKQLQTIDSKVTLVPFNPTAENIAQYLLEVVAPKQLADTNVQVTKIIVEETSNSRAICEL